LPLRAGFKLRNGDLAEKLLSLDWNSPAMADGLLSILINVWMISIQLLSSTEAIVLFLIGR
jgi:hypothetical protein